MTLYVSKKEEGKKYLEYTVDEKKFYKEIINTEEEKITKENKENVFKNDDTKFKDSKFTENCSSPLSKRKLEQPRRKRYSDQFKDPLFIKKDNYRKLKMIENFLEKNEDIESVIEEYKNYIKSCIGILKSEFDVKARELFKIFKLNEIGYSIEDFDSEEDESSEKEKNDNYEDECDYEE